MSDWYLEPPDEPEHPEWYCCLEQLLEEEEVPADVKTKIKKVLSDWVEETNQGFPEPLIDPVEELPDSPYYPF